MFAGYIAYCSQQGIISGYGDGTFRPAGTLTGYAFMKMLLGALGYSSEAEGFTGANWTINVAKLTSGIGLADGNDEFSGTAAVTREEASLYAFNTLQADLVEYEKGNTVIINGQQITSSTDRKAKAVKWLNSSDNDGNIDGTVNDAGRVVGDGYIQFAEQYFNKLVRTRPGNDFNEPATKWTWKGDKIGTYTDTPDVAYSSNVKLGQIYSDLGMTQKDSADVYYNGIPVDKVAVSKNNSLKISNGTPQNRYTDASGNDIDLVGDGTRVHVYYDEDTNDVTICLIDVYVGEVTNVVSKAEAPYVIIQDKGGKIVDEDGNSTSFGTGTTDHFEDTSFAEDDIVLFTYSQAENSIQEVWNPETVEGEITKIVSKKSVNLSETTYKYAKNITFLVSDDETEVQTKNDYVLYLDENGLVLYIDEQEFRAEDYAFVLYTESNSTKFGRDRVQLVTADGTLLTCNTDDDYSTWAGLIVTYRKNSDGEYVLRKAPNSNFVDASGVKTTISGSATNTLGVNIDPVTTVTGSDTTVVPAESGWNGNKSMTPSSNDGGVALNGSTTFNMSNDSARITVSTTGAGVTVQANSETIFVVAQTTPAADGAKTTYQAYKGIKNAPVIQSTGGTGGTAANVEMFYYERGNNLLAFAFIDATNAYITAGNSDILFLAGEKGRTNSIINIDNQQYYEYNAVKDGEITTVMVRSDAEINVGGTDQPFNVDKFNGAYKNVRYNSKGYITGMTAIEATDTRSATYVDQKTGGKAPTYFTNTAARNGVWKLAGNYTVGLGGTVAVSSAAPATSKYSTRYTVSTGAKLFYVDKDGVITKLDSTSDIYSDADYGYVAVMDTRDGDLDYLFIQERVNDKEDSTVSGGVYGLSLTRVTSGLKLVWKNATTNTMTVKITEIVGGVPTTVSYTNSAAGWTAAQMAAGITLPYTPAAGGVVRADVYNTVAQAAADLETTITVNVPD